MREDKALELIQEEYDRAARDYQPMNSIHEGYAILLEEVDELWDWVKKKPGSRNKEEIQVECAQIAAMAQRIMVDIL